MPSRPTTARDSKGKAPARDDDDEATTTTRGSSSPTADEPPPFMSGSNLRTTTKVSEDGRLLLDLRFAKLLPDLPPDYANDVAEPYVEQAPAQIPKLNILIMLVGSRGDVEPFIALALTLLRDGHRVRIATHGVFREFVRSAGGGRLDFFDVSGDLKELMAWMVKNPGLMPGMDSLTNGDIGRKKKLLAGIMHGCYLATHMPDSETGQRFTPDVLMANPPSFAHIHLAEALGLPLQITFCMPFTTPTVAFSHPLVHIKSSNAKPGLTNYLSFAVADLFTWQGLSGVTNSFRKKTLGVPPLTGRSGPSVLERLRVPHTYCWSPSVIPKPHDWRNMIDVSGFYFLDGVTDYRPPADLQTFLDAGEAPIYIGFGSVPVSDPAAMSAIIFDAVERVGARAVVSVGWAGLGSVDVDPKRIFLLGDIPHDWLFKRVRAVVHHGGAGTTAKGLLNGLPTVVVPWMADQFFWAEAVAKAGAGPPGIPGKSLTVEKLVDALAFVSTPESAKAARAMGERIRQEDGVAAGVDSLYRHLPLGNMRCDVDPSLVAVWWSRSHCLRLSALAAQVMADAGKLKLADLEPHRPKEYATRKQASDPITGGATAVLECVASYTTGVAEIFYNPPKGLLHVTTAIPRGMLDIIVQVHEGFANLPKSYGSKIRRAKDSDVKDFSTGLEEGAKDLAFSIWDACAGLVMEPYQGGKKNGVAGVAKGVGKSWLNLIMRPSAGALALVALPIHGALKSLDESKARELPAIREIRLKDGEDAFAVVPEPVKQQMLKKWKVLDKQASARRKAFRGEAWRFLGTKMHRSKKADGQVAPPPLTLLDGTEDNEAVDWMKPPSYDDVQPGKPSGPP